eukprot:273302-Chlamydomonas_euryale.AAC.1
MACLSGQQHPASGLTLGRSAPRMRLMTREVNDATSSPSSWISGRPSAGRWRHAGHVAVKAQGVREAEQVRAGNARGTQPMIRGAEGMGADTQPMIRGAEGMGGSVDWVPLAAHT